MIIGFRTWHTVRRRPVSLAGPMAQEFPRPCQQTAWSSSLREGCRAQQTEWRSRTGVPQVLQCPGRWPPGRNPQYGARNEEEARPRENDDSFRESHVNSCWRLAVDTPMSHSLAKYAWWRTRSPQPGPIYVNSILGSRSPGFPGAVHRGAYVCRPTTVQNQQRKPRIQHRWIFPVWVCRSAETSHARRFSSLARQAGHNLNNTAWSVQPCEKDAATQAQNLGLTSMH